MTEFIEPNFLRRCVLAFLRFTASTIAILALCLVWVAFSAPNGLNGFLTQAKGIFVGAFAAGLITAPASAWLASRHQRRRASAAQPGIQADVASPRRLT